MARPTESKTSPRRMEAKERQRQALELRIAGVTLEVIAERVGFRSRQAAWDSIRRALEAIPRPAAEQLRALDVERLDKMALAIWPRCLQGDLSAIDRAMRIFSQRARLLGYEVNPEPAPSGQQLLPGQREVIMRVVYDDPPRIVSGQDLLESSPTLLELEALTNGDHPDQ